jgi:propionate CoA-transferase
MPKAPKVVTADEAVKHIQSASMIAINCFAMLNFPDELMAALEKRFLETGEPRNMTYWNAMSGSRGAGLAGERFRHEGFLKKMVMSHWSTSPNLVAMAVENKFEAYNLPLGVMSHLLRAAAGRKPGILSPIGLKTFMDPRYGGGRLNASAKDSWTEVMKIDNQEYLFYRAPKVDVCFIRGTTADPRGNVTMEKEAAFLDPLTFAQATKANGGLVICQVERLSELRAHPKAVKVPGFLIDYITVSPEQKINRVETYNPAYSGEIVLSHEAIKAHNEKLIAFAKGGSVRNLEDWVIARRAAQELRPDFVVNLGFGMPDMVGAVAQQEGIADDLLFTIETGIVGGVPAASGGFGAAINPEAIIEESFMFDAYDGGALDASFVGAAEIDQIGSVNVSLFGSFIAGVGGFVHITQNAKKVVFMTTFRGGKGLEIAFENGALKIKSEGNSPKFKKSLKQINYSGEYAREHNQDVMYITERCVIRQSPEGLIITEVAPGIDMEKDIMSQMEFRPAVSSDLKIMDKNLFTAEPLNIRKSWGK